MAFLYLLRVGLERSEQIGESEIGLVPYLWPPMIEEMLRNNGLHFGSGNGCL